MKRENEWKKLATQALIIQKTKNDVLNGKVIALIHEYAGHGAKVFDYGCGWGEFAELLCDEGFETFAFDQSDEMIELAKEKFKSPKFLFRDEFAKGLRDSKSGTFDLVVSNLVLCILTKQDQEEMLEKSKRILKNDGTLVLSFCHPCFDYHVEGVVSFRKAPEGAKYDQEFEYEKQIKENDISFHDTHRPLSYYSKLFKKMGLSILEISESEIFESEFYPDFITFVLKKKG